MPRKMLTLRHYAHRRLSSESVSELEPSSTLLEAWPRLKENFDRSANPDGDFPLLSVKQQRDIYQRVDQSSNRRDRQAAVLVLLCSVSGNPALIVTRRASHLNTHAAEMSLPGGHFEEDRDGDLIDTAIREAEEELLPTKKFFGDSTLRSHLTVLGKATALPSLHGTPVTPVIAVLWPDLNPPIEEIFPGDQTEVDLVLAVTLGDLVNGETKRPIESKGVRLPDAPVYPTPHGNIWGLTAYILKPLMRKLFRPAFQVTAEE